MEKEREREEVIDSLNTEGKRGWLEWRRGTENDIVRRIFHPLQMKKFQLQRHMRIYLGQRGGGGGGESYRIKGFIGGVFNLL